MLVNDIAPTNNRAMPHAEFREFCAAVSGAPVYESLGGHRKIPRGRTMRKPRRMSFHSQPFQSSVIGNDGLLIMLRPPLLKSFYTPLRVEGYESSLHHSSVTPKRGVCASALHGGVSGDVQI